MERLTLYKQWRNYGAAAAGPAAGGQAKSGPKGPIFKPYRARWKIGFQIFEILLGPKILIKLRQSVHMTVLDKIKNRRLR